MVPGKVNEPIEMPAKILCYLEKAGMLHESSFTATNQPVVLPWRIISPPRHHHHAHHPTHRGKADWLLAQINEALCDPTTKANTTHMFMVFQVGTTAAPQLMPLPPPPLLLFRSLHAILLGLRLCVLL